jgi:hypothetical protein
MMVWEERPQVEQLQRKVDSKVVVDSKATRSRKASRRISARA